MAFKKILLVIASFLLFIHFSHAQFGAQEAIEKPVTWSISTTEINDSSFEIILNATVDSGWYLYSQETEEGPIPLEFNYGEDSSYSTEGNTSEKAELIKAAYEEAFEVDVIKLFGDSEFRQKINIADNTGILKGSLLFQTCKEVCLPPESVPFAVKLSDLSAAIGDRKVAKLLDEKVEIAAGETIGWPSYGNPLNDCENNATASSSTDSSSNWGIFVLGLLGGLVALLTPCVFPMIPLTVTFFTKRHEKKAKGIFEAIVYGFSIFLIYFLLALPFLLFKLPKDTLYRISTSPILNVSFFIIFIVFALSLFGYFEMTLPNKWANKTDKVSNKGGFVGIFFMAITLAIVSFSCTGPILGSLMAGTIATEGGQLKLVYGMSGFGVALGLPFALFAMFPGVLKKLPKSGSWMTTVKVVLAFVEVALALKFLSNADLVQQWGIIKYEVFIAIWALISLGLALYLFGFIRFPHDSKLKKLSIGRGFFGVLTLLFTGYLVSGFFGNGLNALSGFPPPKHYSVFKSNEDHTTILDLDEGIELSNQTGKPMLLDFTGWTCVNCRKVEQNIWTDPEVAKRLEEDFILVSLYADESEKLPESEQYYSEALSKNIKTIGEKWTDFEASSFGKITQPLYAVVSAEGELMNAPISYTSSVDDYIAFLDCGKETFATR